jgi:hypothetical protein
MVCFVFIAYPRGAEYWQKNIKRTLITDIHDPNKIFLDSNMQSDENKWLTGIGTNAS